MSRTGAASPVLPGSLRIRFRRGERPYMFWVSRGVHPEGEPLRFKVLSKAHADRSLEVLVIQEEGARGRETLAHLELPAALPAGWLERWVATLEGELGTRFESFDLRNVRTEKEWREAAARLGWIPGAPRPA